VSMIKDEEVFSLMGTQKGDGGREVRRYKMGRVADAIEGRFVAKGLKVHVIQKY
jgi:hypothetical protein